MKKLKVRLDDGNIYTFQTFSMTESAAMKRKYREMEVRNKEIYNKQFKTDEKGELVLDTNGDPQSLSLTVNQYDEIDKLELESFRDMASALQKSLVKNHKEFDSSKESLDRICSLVDARLLRRLIEFIFFGTYIREPEEVDDTKWEEDEK